MPDAKQGHDKKHYEDAERSQLSGTQYRSVAHTPRQRHDRTVPGKDGQRRPGVYGYRSQALFVVPTTGATHRQSLTFIEGGAGSPGPVCVARMRGSVEDTDEPPSSRKTDECVPARGPQ
jgi:hypothetical protein